MRKFRQTSRQGIEKTANLETFRVLTYNILADKFASSNWLGISEDVLSWENRCPRILKELFEGDYQADVLSLQEVERPFMDGELGERLEKQGYQYHFYGRKAKAFDSVKGPEEGVCLAFSTEKFRNLAWKSVRLSDHIETLGPSTKPADSAEEDQKTTCSDFWQFLAKREEGAVLSLVQDCRNSSLLVLCATHLFWDPIYPDIKAAQASLLCRAIRGFMEENKVFIRKYGVGSENNRLPIIVAGDFNAMPQKTQSDEYDEIPSGSCLVSAVYTILTQGSLPNDHLEHPFIRSNDCNDSHIKGLVLHSEGIVLGSAGKAAWGHEPPFTNKTKTFSGCLDYIFYSKEFLDVIEYLELPYEWHEAASFEPLPTARWPSDHLAIGFTFQWH